MWHSQFSMIPLRNPRQLGLAAVKDSSLASGGGGRREAESSRHLLVGDGVGASVSLRQHQTSKIVPLCCVLAQSGLCWQLGEEL